MRSVGLTARGQGGQFEEGGEGEGEGVAVYERQDGVVRGAEGEGEEGVEQLEQAWERCCTRTRQRA